VARGAAGGRDGVLAFALGAAASLGFAWAVYATLGPPGFAGPDTPAYLGPAEEISRSGIPTLVDLLSARRTMGYPLLLASAAAVFDDPTLVVVFLQAFGTGCASWLAFSVTRRLSDSRAARLGAAAAVALSPNVISHSALLLTDSLHALAVLAGAALIFEAFRSGRDTLLVCGSLSWAAAQTLRPTMHFAAILLAAIFIAMKSRVGHVRRSPGGADPDIGGWTPATATVIASLAVVSVLPVAFVIGNGLRFGIWTTNRTDETNARLLAATVLGAATRRDHREIVREWENEEAGLSSPREIRESRLGRAREALIDHPVIAARVGIVNAAKILLAPAESLYLPWTRDRGRITWIAAALALGNVAAWALSLAGGRAASGDRAGRMWIVIAALVSIYVLVLSAPAGFQGARFRLPLDLVLAALAGIGMASLTPGGISDSSRGTGGARSTPRECG
jgi:hypothetical protein